MSRITVCVGLEERKDKYVVPCGTMHYLEYDGRLATWRIVDDAIVTMPKRGYRNWILCKIPNYRVDVTKYVIATNTEKLLPVMDN